MATYGDYCPMSRAAEIFATRWTPIIVRNLLLGCETFSELRAAAPGISRTLLTQRLRMLEHHGVVDRRPGPSGTPVYELTEAGEGLCDVCDALGSWGQRWVELAPEHFDAARVLLHLSKLIEPDDLPDRRTVLRFDITKPEGDRYWLLLDAPRTEVCRRPPGERDDLIVSASSEALVRWHVGELTLGQAMHAGSVSVEGPRYLQRLLASWGGQVHFPEPATG
ncbi:MAG TPA: winged helix-turn-helix transcriptional regulator [Solirubrobacterales bacterium]|nr:winged helix-turn-helix transcriptional regulator [Solirubrobacterales bacterium]